MITSKNSIEVKGKTKKIQNGFRAKISTSAHILAIRSLEQIKERNLPDALADLKTCKLTSYFFTIVLD